MNWIFTPAYCKSSMLEGCLKNLYESPTYLDGFTHVIIDQHYPVDIDHNRKAIQDLCKQYGCTYIDSGYDRGLHGGINNAMQVLSVKPTDAFIGCDPDDRPSPGAIQALKRVMEADPSVAVAALNFWVIPWKMKEHGLVMKEETIGGEHVWIHPGVEMFNVVSFNMKLVHELGGFHQPNAYYGGIEISLFHEWFKRGMKLVYLRDHNSEHVKVDRDDPSLYDKSYGEWKIAHATKGFKGSFQEWLNQ